MARAERRPRIGSSEDGRPRAGQEPQQLGPLGCRRRARHHQPDHARALVSRGQLVRTGKVFDLGINFDSNGPAAGRRPQQTRCTSCRPPVSARASGAASATRRLRDHAACSAPRSGTASRTSSYDQQLYNGFPASEVTPKGTLHVGIEKQGKGITGRGVLLRHRRAQGREVARGGTRSRPRISSAADAKA